MATSSGLRALQSTTCRSDSPCASAILSTGATPARVSQKSRLESSATLASSVELPGWNTTSSTFSECPCKSQDSGQHSSYHKVFSRSRLGPAELCMQQVLNDQWMPDKPALVPYPNNNILHCWLERERWPGCNKPCCCRCLDRSPLLACLTAASN